MKDPSPFKLDLPAPGSSVPYVTKGTKIRARWFGSPQAVALAGVQMKLQVTEFVVEGTVRHLRGNDPVAPTKIDLYVEPSGPVPQGVRQERPYGCSCDGHDQLVRIDADHVVAVL